MDRENLPLAVEDRFGADAKPFDNQTAVRRPFAIGYNRPSGIPVANVDRKRADCSDIRVIQPRDGIEPPQQGRQNHLPVQARISSSRAVCDLKKRRRPMPVPNKG
jgi:hypothetical protein